MKANNTSTTMNANEINARRAANEFVNKPTHRVNTVDKHGNEMNCPAWGLDMAEAIAADRRAKFPNDTTEIVSTGSTEYTNEAAESSELTHAGQCLDIYLHNTGEIYERYTVPAINAVVEAVRSNGWQLPKDEAIKNLTFWTSWQPGTEKALQAAARLVRKYDHLTPTAQDIEQVTRNYAAYIIESATFEIENA